MPVSVHIHLRRLSVILLAVAFAMLIGGFTFLEPRLRGVAFVIYWLGCFAVAGLAIITALLDLLVIRRDARRAQHILIEDSFQGMSVKPPSQSAKTNGSARPGSAGRNASASVPAIPLGTVGTSTYLSLSGPKPFRDNGFSNAQLPPSPRNNLFESNRLQKFSKNSLQGKAPLLYSAFRFCPKGGRTG